MDAVVSYVPKMEAQVVRKKKTAVVEDVLAAIVRDNGRVTSAMIVEAAEAPEHPLHEYFEWNDTEAGRKYRLAQATAMILATKYVCFLQEKRGQKKAGKVVAAARDATQVRRLLPDFSGGFRERVDVLSDEESRRSIVEKKLSVLRSWCNSVVDISELASVRDGVLSLLG